MSRPRKPAASAPAPAPSVEVAPVPAPVPAPRRAVGRASFWLHLHPPRVAASTLRPGTTLGLGVLAITLLGVLAATGVALMLLYTPSPTAAHEDLRDLAYAVPFGSLLRNLHRLATHALIAVVALHLGRVLLVAAYRGRRWLNWLVGLCLLVVTLGFAFTGYLLPWDQTAYWACTVGADMLGLVPVVGPGLKGAFLGGDTVAARSLLRFYALHVAVLPGLGLALLGYHLWRLRKDGGLALSSDGEARADDAALVEPWPQLALREATLIAVTLAVLTLLALVVDAPLGELAMPARPDNPEKAPWYFVGMQEMVSYSAVSGVLLFPSALLLAILLLPLLERSGSKTGHWFADAGALPCALAALAGAATASLGLWAWEQGLTRPGLADPASLVVAVALLCAAAAYAWRRRLSAAAGSLAGALVAAYVVFTLVGALCRGPSWVFFWPWQPWTGGAG